MPRRNTRFRGYSSSIAYDAFQSGVQILNVYPRAIATGMNLGREDFDQLIDPVELAEFLASLCTPKTFCIGSIQIDRGRNRFIKKNLNFGLKALCYRAKIFF